ncbi:MbcA/ParS/Xre antitoxin family protein [Akkermansiaceae bacterium]|nr:MbcA/ParS/Xre antitoxin family protein [Akkermansiaceae bacterium]
MLKGVVRGQVDLLSPEAGRVALKGFFAIAERWGLSGADQMTLLGGLPRSTFHAYRKLPKVGLSRDLIERISLVMGIYKALQISLADSERVERWIHHPITAALFSGQSALERMTAGSITDLAVVRDYLDAQQGW